MYLKIRNNGEIDPRILSLMGGTTKRGNNELIGNFGTGLKYSIAYLVRNNIDFKIFSGEEEIKITTQKEVIRDVEFNIIKVNGEKTSITDSTGVDWKPWMIVREIYSNALDEGGAYYGTSHDCEGQSGTTTIFIDLTVDFLNVYNSWDSYFLKGKTPVYEDYRVKIYPSQGPLRVYKQGILIYKDNNTNSLFTYDLKTASLNELREYKGSLEHDLIRLICSIDDEKIISYFLENSHKKDLKEYTLDFDFWDSNLSKEWKKALEGTKIIHTEALKRLEETQGNINKSDYLVMPKNMYAFLSRKVEGIGALRVSKAVNDFIQVYSDKLHDKIRNGERLLKELGYAIEKDVKQLSYI